MLMSRCCFSPGTSITMRPDGRARGAVRRSDAATLWLVIVGPFWRLHFRFEPLPLQTSFGFFFELLLAVLEGLLLVFASALTGSPKAPRAKRTTATVRTRRMVIPSTNVTPRSKRGSIMWANV